MQCLTGNLLYVSVDIWDGPEMPVVYHGNTLTSKIAFSDVVSVISQFAFEASKSVLIKKAEKIPFEYLYDNKMECNGFGSKRYPLFIHLENHCSVPQQKTAASIMKDLFGTALLKVSDKLVTLTTPEEMIGKIIIFV